MWEISNPNPDALEKAYIAGVNSGRACAVVTKQPGSLAIDDAIDWDPDTTFRTALVPFSRKGHHPIGPVKRSPSRRTFNRPSREEIQALYKGLFIGSFAEAYFHTAIVGQEKFTGALPVVDTRTPGDLLYYIPAFLDPEHSTFDPAIHDTEPRFVSMSKNEMPRFMFWQPKPQTAVQGPRTTRSNAPSPEESVGQVVTPTALAVNTNTAEKHGKQVAEPEWEVFDPRAEEDPIGFLEYYNVKFHGHLGIRNKMMLREEDIERVHHVSSCLKHTHQDLTSDELPARPTPMKELSPIRDDDPSWIAFNKKLDRRSEIRRARIQPEPVFTKKYCNETTKHRDPKKAHLTRELYEDYLRRTQLAEDEVEDRSKSCLACGLDWTKAGSLSKQSHYDQHREEYKKYIETVENRYPNLEPVVRSQSLNPPDRGVPGLNWFAALERNLTSAENVLLEREDTCRICDQKLDHASVKPVDHYAEHAKQRDILRALGQVENASTSSEVSPIYIVKDNGNSIVPVSPDSPEARAFLGGRESFRGDEEFILRHEKAIQQARQAEKRETQIFGENLVATGEYIRRTGSFPTLPNSSPNVLGTRSQQKSPSNSTEAQKGSLNLPGTRSQQKSPVSSKEAQKGSPTLVSPWGSLKRATNAHLWINGPLAKDALSDTDESSVYEPRDILSSATKRQTFNINNPFAAEFISDSEPEDIADGEIDFLSNYDDRVHVEALLEDLTESQDKEAADLPLEDPSEPADNIVSDSFFDESSDSGEEALVGVEIIKEKLNPADYDDDEDIYAAPPAAEPVPEMWLRDSSDDEDSRPQPKAGISSRVMTMNDSSDDEEDIDVAASEAEPVPEMWLKDSSDDGDSGSQLGAKDVPEVTTLDDSSDDEVTTSQPEVRDSSQMDVDDSSAGEVSTSRHEAGDPSQMEADDSSDDSSVIIIDTPAQNYSIERPSQRYRRMREKENEAFRRVFPRVPEHIVADKEKTDQTCAEIDRLAGNNDDKEFDTDFEKEFDEANDKSFREYMAKVMNTDIDLNPEIYGMVDRDREHLVKDGVRYFLGRYRRARKGRVSLASSSSDSESDVDTVESQLPTPANSPTSGRKRKSSEDAEFIPGPETPKRDDELSPRMPKKPRRSSDLTYYPGSAKFDPTSPPPTPKSSTKKSAGKKSKTSPTKSIKVVYNCPKLHPTMKTKRKNAIESDHVTFKRPEPESPKPDPTKKAHGKNVSFIDDGSADETPTETIPDSPSTRKDWKKVLTTIDKGRNRKPRTKKTSPEDKNGEATTTIGKKTIKCRNIDPTEKTKPTKKKTKRVVSGVAGVKKVKKDKKGKKDKKKSEKKKTAKKPEPIVEIVSSGRPVRKAAKEGRKYYTQTKIID